MVGRVEEEVRDPKEKNRDGEVHKRMPEWSLARSIGILRKVGTGERLVGSEMLLTPLY